MNNRLMFRAAIAALAVTATLGVSVPAAFAQPPKKKPATPAQPPRVKPNETKGQGQVSGANGRFGEIYTLNDDFNFEILSARYSLEPHASYGLVLPTKDEKIVLLTVAIKNARASDNDFNPEGHAFTLVDSNGQNYSGNSYVIQSKPGESFFPNLKPGQGLGQASPATGKPTDPVTVAIKVPAAARITKIILNRGRKGRSEEVIRYYVAGATKAEAGEDGDPKNVIAPLPEGAYDPADKSGAVALVPAKGKLGVLYPSGAYGIRLDSLTFSTTETFDGAAPEEGKRYAIATVTSKNLSAGKQGFFDLYGGDNPKFSATDSDGETAKLVGFRKAKRDEFPEKDYAPGEEYAFRVFFLVPKDTTLKSVTLSSGAGFPWAIDTSAIK